LFLINNFNAFPKSDVIFDFLRRVFRLRIKPSRVFVGCAVCYNIVITRRAFPGANRVRLALAEKFFVYRVCGKIMISFDSDCCIAFG